MSLKVCYNCSKKKSIEDFYFVKYKLKKYYRRDCKECIIKRSKTNYLKKRDYWLKKNKENKIKLRYKLETEEYLDLFKIQKNKCKICNTKVAPYDRDSCVDHCHTTNKNRAILCQSCNKGIGNFKEDINILKKSIKYLLETKTCKD